MGKRKAIEIAFVGLKPGIHEFTYVVDDSFFAEAEGREFANCTATVKLQLDKKSSFFLLKFEVGGIADVACDRCGNQLTKDLWDEFNILVKMVDNPEEMNQQEEDPDVYYISRSESQGIALTEAWSMNVPTYVWDTGIFIYKNIIIQ